MKRVCFLLLIIFSSYHLTDATLDPDTLTYLAPSGVAENYDQRLFTPKKILLASAIGGCIYYWYRQSLVEEVTEHKELALRSVSSQPEVPENNEENKEYTTEERLKFFGKGLGYAFASTLGLAFVGSYCYQGYQHCLTEDVRTSLESLYSDAALMGLTPDEDDLRLQKLQTLANSIKKILYVTIPVSYAAFMYKYRFIQTADDFFKKAFHKKEIA